MNQVANNKSEGYILAINVTTKSRYPKLNILIKTVHPHAPDH
jgi:hypothetical protein